MMFSNHDARWHTSERKYQYSLACHKGTEENYKSLHTPRSPLQAPPPASEEMAWWHGSLLYQINTLSFADSNGDGFGDLGGIRSRLDYIRSLGVDGILLSMNNLEDLVLQETNDTEDSEALEDLQELLHAAHEHHLKVVLSLPIHQVSVRHRWFQESRKGPHNSKSDWFVWAKAKDDGAPPTNWISEKNGSAWHWDELRNEFFLHRGSARFAALNLTNDEVQSALVSRMELLLNRGIDGLMIESVDSLAHDRFLRDNPPRQAQQNAGPELSPFQRQSHVYDRSLPDTLEFIARLRKEFDRYPMTALLGEVKGLDQQDIHQYSEGGNLLHSVAAPNFLQPTLNTSSIRTAISELQEEYPHTWPLWSLSNNAIPRAVTRWNAKGAVPNFAKLMTVLMGSMRGTGIIYQGDELGLPHAACLEGEETDLRLGGQYPMPWVGSAPSAGFFTGATPWSPLAFVPEEYRALAVDVQEKDKASTLSFTKKMISLRKRFPQALKHGDIHFLQFPQPHILAYMRIPPTADGSTPPMGDCFLFAFNFGTEHFHMRLPEYIPSINAMPELCVNAKIAEERIVDLPAGSVFVGVLTEADGPQFSM